MSKNQKDTRFLYFAAFQGSVVIQHRRTHSATNHKQYATMHSFVRENQLGKGGFSIVHRATSFTFPSPGVALKQISKQRLAQNDLVKLIENEVSIHSRCEHPNIVQYYDYFEDDHHINIVLELCQGGDCAQLLRKQGQLPQRLVCTYVKELIQALAYLHRNNIYHRDIKLSNMLLQKSKSGGGENARRYTIKLADFGLAKHVNLEEEEDHVDHTVCGTKLCMAPEVIWGRPQGPPADIFSVGVVAYTMLVGANPFQREQPVPRKPSKKGGSKRKPLSEPDVFPLSSAMERIGRGTFTIPSHVSSEAADFIRQAMCVDPSQRPTAHDLLEHGFITGKGVFPARVVEEEEDGEEEEEEEDDEEEEEEEEREEEEEQQQEPQE